MIGCERVDPVGAGVLAEAEEDHAAAAVHRAAQYPRGIGRRLPSPIEVEPVSKRIQVVLGGVTDADSMRAHRCSSRRMPPTYYVPREDVLVAALVAV